MTRYTCALCGRGKTSKARRLLDVVSWCCEHRRLECGRCRFYESKHLVGMK